jgi:hypothetical protein
MGKPAYIATNLVENAVSLNLVNEHDSVNFPSSYVGDQILATVSKFDGTGGQINIDLAASPFTGYDSVYIGNYNLTAAGSLFIYLGTSLGTVAFNAAPSYRAKQLWASVGTQTVNDFVQVQMIDTTLNNRLEVGEVVVGTRVVLPRAPMWGIRKQQRNAGITNETLGGVQWDYELNHYKVFEMTFRFPESEYAAFLAFSDAVGRSPFVYIPDVNTSEAYYVRKQRGFEPVPIEPAMDGSAIAHWYDWTLSLRTESEGISVNA